MESVLVQTWKGLLPIGDLRIDQTKFGCEGDAFVAARDWYLGDELVKRDEVRWEGMVTDGCIGTTAGPLPLAALECRETRSAGPNELKVMLEWYHDGEFVRSDAWVTMLRGESLAEASHSNFNGSPPPAAALS